MEKTQNYKPSEKAQTLSAPAKDLGPEFRAGEVAHEIDRYRGILRNPAATAEEVRISIQRLEEIAEQYQIAIPNKRFPTGGVL